MLNINFQKSKEKKNIYISYVIAVRLIWYCRETSRSALCLFEHNLTPYNS